MAKFTAPPLCRYGERFSLIGELGYRVVRNETAGCDLIERINPGVLAIGSDWARKNYYSQIDVTQDWLDDRASAFSICPIPRASVPRP